jgi:hypothetical protein
MYLSTYWSVFGTGRKRLEPSERRVDLGVRLPQWMVDELLKLGPKTEQVEKAVAYYLKMTKELGKK